MATPSALAARLARLEAMKASSATSWLVEVPVNATDDEVDLAVAAHRAATGDTGPMVVTPPKMTAEEWAALYDPARRGA